MTLSASARGHLSKLKGLPKDKQKKLTKAPPIGTSGSITQISHGDCTDFALACVFAGLINGDADDQTTLVSVYDFINDYCEVKPRASAAIYAATKAFLSEEKGADASLNAGCLVNVWDYPESKEYILKRLEQVHGSSANPTVFRYGDAYAEVVVNNFAGTANIENISRDRFQTILSDSVKFSKLHEGTGKYVACLPPDDLTKNIYNRRDLPFRDLAGLSRIPRMGVDYKISARPGNNPTTSVYYCPPADLDIPRVPEVITEEVLADARRWLVEEWLGDWPFDGWTRNELVPAALNGDPNNPPPPSLLNAIGFALEQVVRPLIKGNLPPCLFTKPAARTGATNLVNSIQMVVEGITSSMTLQASDEDMEKKIVGFLKSSTAIALLDNVSGEIDSGVLAKWWTDPIFTGRELGHSRVLSIPVQHSHAITTNNATFTGELVARFGMVRLDAKMARPDQRTGFRHSSILEWTKNNRSKLLWCLIVLAVHWVQKGCPMPVTPTKWAGGPASVPSKITWGGYDSYVDVVGGIVGASAPNWTTWQANRNLIEAKAYSGEDDAIIELLNAWYDHADGDAAKLSNMLVGDRTNKDKKTILGLTGIADSNSVSLSHPVRKVSVQEPYRYTPSSLGAWLSRYADRPFALGPNNEEFTLVKSENRGKHGHTWALEPLKKVKAEAEPTAAAEAEVVPIAHARARRRTHSSYG
jgi:hypothetical protein